MTEYTIEAKIRQEDVATTRNNNAIPAIIYGKDFKNLSLSIDKTLFNRLYKEAGSSNIINLSIEGKETLKSLVQEIQLDPVSGEIEHAVWLAWKNEKADVIVLEGQGSLMNPAYPGGFPGQTGDHRLGWLAEGPAFHQRLSTG